MSTPKNHTELTPGANEAVRSGWLPRLSFIVSAYNVEQYLVRCLNSLVFQTCQDIEVLVVNDGSTDKTLEIAARYERKFPNIVRVITKENGGLSSTRKCGLARARAPFVSFVDGDDWVHPSMAELFLEKIDAGADFVYAPFSSVHDGDTSLRAGGAVKLSEKSDSGAKSEYTAAKVISAILRQGNNSFWGKAWNAKFLKERAQFVSLLHEDVAEVPALISWVQHPAIITAPLYFYYQSNTASITKVAVNPRRRDLFQVDRICWEKLNPSYADDFRIKLAKHLGMNLQYAEIFDKSITYAKWAYHYFDLQRIESELEPYRLKKLQEILAYGAPMIPKRLILNGFAGYRECYDVASLKETAFLDEFEIIWIDEEYVQDNVAEKAGLQNVSRSELAAYLACREIAARGGFYLAPHIALTKALTPLIFHSACFVRKTSTGFSSDFFAGGGGIQPQVFERIADAYEDAARAGENQSLERAMTEVLVCRCGVHLQHEAHTTVNGIQIYEAAWLYSPYYEGYKPLTFEAAFDEALPMGSTQTVLYVWQNELAYCEKELENLRRKNGKLVRQRDELKTQRDELKAQRDELRTQRDDLKGQRDELKAQRNELKAQRNELRTQRDELKAQRDELKVQRDELRTQRDELKAQRDELKVQRDELKAQRNELKAQRNELRTQRDELKAQRDELKV